MNKAVPVVCPRWKIRQVNINGTVRDTHLDRIVQLLNHLEFAASLILPELQRVIPVVQKVRIELGVQSSQCSTKALPVIAGKLAP